MMTNTHITTSNNFCLYMEGNEVRKALQANHINLAWLSEQWGITPQALSSRLNAKTFKPGYLIEITQILGKDIFGVGVKSERQPVLNVSANSTATLHADNYPVIEYVSVPYFSGCVGIYYFGRDAEPKYNVGDTIFLHQADSITLGQIYFICTKSERFIRAILPSTNEDNYRLVPLNQSYPEQEVKKKDILQAYKVFGAISREQT